MKLQLSHVAFASGISRALLLTFAICLCFSAKSFGKAAEEYNCGGFDKKAITEYGSPLTYEAVKFTLSRAEWDTHKGDFATQKIENVTSRGLKKVGSTEVEFDLTKENYKPCLLTWEFSNLPNTESTELELIFKSNCEEKDDRSQLPYLEQSHEFHAVCAKSSQ